MFQTFKETNRNGISLKNRSSLNPSLMVLPFHQ